MRFAVKKFSTLLLPIRPQSIECDARFRMMQWGDAHILAGLKHFGFRRGFRSFFHISPLMVVLTEQVFENRPIGL
jgi:hypothetical protein